MIAVKFLYVLLLVIAVSFSSEVVVEEPWVREPPPTSKVAGAFMVILNKGKEADTLVSVSSDIADRTEIHKTIMKNGRMSMRRVNSIVIKPGSKVEFKPGGYHIMLIGLKKSIREGERVKIELEFKRAGTLRVDFPVKKDF